MGKIRTTEPFKVMINNPDEYNLRLQYPTDNLLVHDFHHNHIINLEQFLQGIDQMITNPETLIVFFGLYQNLREQDAYPWLDMLDQYYRDRPNPMILFNGRLTFDEPVPAMSLPYHKLLMFDRISTVNWHDSMQMSNIALDHIPEHRAYKCYWASSKDYYSRRYLLSHIIQNGLLDQGLFNYKCVQTEFSNRQNFVVYGSGFPERYQIRDDWEKYQQIYQQCQIIENQIPLPPLDHTIEFNQTNPNFFLNSYLGLVTDTIYEDTSVFLSEKLFNTINYGQMFWYLGPPHTLKYLRDRGYETFGDVIDERYDEIDDHADRVQIAVRSIIEFLQQPLNVIQDCFQKCLPRIKHNKQLLMTQRPDLEFTRLCEQAIQLKK
jgi:hypothetical protein